MYKNIHSTKPMTPARFSMIKSRLGCRSNADFARLLGVSSQSIYRYQRGRIPKTVADLVESFYALHLIGANDRGNDSPRRSFPVNIMVFDDRATGERCRKLRESDGLSMRTVAHAMGITESYLSLLECGKRRWTVDYAEKFEAAIMQAMEAEK